MGWEMRRGKRVYYRKVREGRSVRSLYCGSGEKGEAAAREDAERRADADVAHAPQTDASAACATEAAPLPVAGFTAVTKTPIGATVVEDAATTPPAPPPSARAPYRPGAPSPTRPLPRWARPLMSIRDAVHHIKCLLAADPRRQDLKQVIANLNVDDQTRTHLRWTYVRKKR
jgi:hypothetical protein